MCIYSTKKQKSVVLYLYAKTATNWDNHLLRLLLQKICMISYNFFCSFNLKDDCLNSLVFFEQKQKTSKFLFLWSQSTFCSFTIFFMIKRSKLFNFHFCFRRYKQSSWYVFFFIFASLLQTSSSNQRFTMSNTSERSSCCKQITTLYIFWELSTIWVAFLPTKCLLFCMMWSCFAIQHFTDRYWEKRKTCR